MSTMTQTPPGRPWTYDDYLLFPDDGNRYEIIGGERFVTAAPNALHQILSVRLTSSLFDWVDDQGLGTVVSAPSDVIFSNIDIVQPDVLFFTASPAEYAEARDEHVPALVVEILSPSTRRQDEILKRGVYERFGVTEYWIVDPELETVKVYRRSGEAFAAANLLSSDRSLTTDLVSGWSLELQRLFTL